jgi:putative peptidoglycan lipid II flippase
MIRSAWISSLLTLASRILGLARDKGLVLVFGPAAGVLDAFLLAFTIPNLFRRLFGEGALSAAFIPVYLKTRDDSGREEADRFASALVTSLAAFLGAIVLAGMLACFGAAAIWPGGDHALALRLTGAMLPFLALVCLAAVCAGLLQAERRFALPAAMPILLNVAFLAATTWVWWTRPFGERAGGIYWLAAGVVAAGAVQLLLQWIALRARGVGLKPLWAPSHPGLGRVLAAMGPTAAGLALFQINVLVDRLIAYLLVADDGALTHLYLGNRLMQLPLGLFGVAMATVAFPELVSHLAKKEWKDLFGRLQTATRFLLFILLPAAAGMAAVSEPVVRMIFQEPDLVFDDADVYRTSVVLALYAPGLFFIAWQQLVSRAFYAQGDYRTPVRITAWMVGANLALNLVLVHAPDLYAKYAHGTDARLNEGGLALSTSICAIVQALWLWRILRARLRPQAPAHWDDAFAGMGAAIGRIAAAAAGTGLMAFWIARSIPAEPELLVRVERGLAGVIGGVIVYLILCEVIPVPEIAFLRRSSGREGEEQEGGE